MIAGKDTLINSLKRGFCSQSILGNKFISEQIALFWWTQTCLLCLWMDMNLSKLQEIVEDIGAWRAAVHGVTELDTA